LDPEVSFAASSINPARKDSATLVVSLPRAQAGFDTTRMVYLLRPHEVSYYAFNQWADTPARMLMRLLALAMEKRALWVAVFQMPGPVRPDYRLDSDNLVLEQQFFSKPSRVRLALRAQLIDMKRQTVMDSRSFEIFEEAPTEDAYGGVIAANRAAVRLLDEVAAWLAMTMRESG
jgi:cholesterol transport system auxiliary component